ncbi:ATP--guanido phosphotransferase [Leptospira perdikensis]|uniref:ATP--guanido phosphotransferase n=1 Tax=Leptospira perdikensis TaxID=2484948 RepID=A0A4R9JGZ0_9LEPT|nr:ATP--guanido phosphotransferase [Leptospira perdikensis]TGL39759.1 ATP--guanido phosphotransferase [Leptospira perdikensis]
MIFCRFCGTKEIQFRKSGKFGCANCVQVFEYPKPNEKRKIPEIQIQTLEKFIKENLGSFTLISLRTRITRNLKSSLFPFYDPLIDKSKQLLVDTGMDLYQYPNEFEKNLGSQEIQEPRMGIYLGSEDHIRWETILPRWEKEGRESAKIPRGKVSLFRFLFQKKYWATLPELGFISSCPTNLGKGRRDSILLGLTPGIVSEFFSILQTLVKFGIEFAPSTDHRFRNIGKDRVLVVKISWKNIRVVQKRQFYKILSLLGSY